MPQRGAVVSHEKRAGEVPVPTFSKRGDGSGQQCRAQPLPHVPRTYQDPGEVRAAFVDQCDKNRSHEALHPALVDGPETRPLDDRPVASHARVFHAFAGDVDSAIRVQRDQWRHTVEGGRQELR